jgi:hypothetical protein
LLSFYTRKPSPQNRSNLSGHNFAQRVKTIRPKLKVEVVKRADDISGLKVLPRRWGVEPAPSAPPLA